MDDINVSDNTHALAVLQQAQRNVEGYARIRSVALDRGFLDGDLLSHIVDDEKITVYIPAKSNMRITEDAREIARRAEKEALSGRTLPGTVYRERHETVTRGSGKNATEEVRTTTLVGMELPCDWWMPGGSTSAANAKSFEPRKVRATVVLRWDGAPPKKQRKRSSF